MRRAVLLAGGALLAGAGMFFSSGAGPTPKAAIAGDSLESKPTADEVARYESLAEDSIKHATIDLQLDKMVLKDGHYEAPLRDGRRATLTLDPDLQKLAEKLLDESRAPRGAIVAMTPDGKILAFAGRRTEEPKGGKQGTFDYHLVTDVWAPAASIFKLVTASALLSNGYNADNKVCYHGGVRSVMESNLSDSKLDGNCETLGYGVAHSNNAILGKLAYQNLEPTLLDHTARDLGWTMAPSSLGVKASCGELDLPKDKDLEFAKAAAGFKGSKLSVLGGALLSATFAAGGEQPTPRIIESINGKPFAAPKPKRVLPEAVAKTVASMMKETCESGSASKTFRKRAVDVAGKTGTLSTNKPFYMEHSWFVGFAPADQPQVVVSVLLGNPESWHLRGHEAAKRMIDRAIRRAGDREADSQDAPKDEPTKTSRRASKRHR
ncbi:MAG TPA: penicillin-binding transpeptidase domain-containing protein [Kofleriaceae bacterium]